MATRILADRFDLGPNDQLGRHFKVLKTLGAGTFGIVYLVHDLRDKTQKAAKILKLYSMEPKNREEISKRFEREFECGQIRSKYLVHASEQGNFLGNPYLIMEYCQHGSIKNWVGRSPDFKSVQDFAVSTLSGLEVLHQNGIIHRDLKPDNILLSDHNQTKLTDFGIAGFQNSRMTRRNLRGDAKDIFGTYAYIAPEQANSKSAFKTLGPNADLWSFGVTLFEVVTGHLPFGRLVDQPDLGEYLKRSAEGNFDSIRRYRPDTPSHLVELVEACLQINLEQRVQSVRQALQIIGYDNDKTIRLSTDYVFGRDLFGLQVKHGEEPGRIYNLSRAIPSGNGQATIGWYDRAQPHNNSITLVEKQSEYISRYHATIEKDGNNQQWIIRDGQYRINEGVPEKRWYKSLNGTYVNGQKVNPQGRGMRIKPNDIITIGDTTLKVVFKSLTR